MSHHLSKTDYDKTIQLARRDLQNYPRSDLLILAASLNIEPNQSNAKLAMEISKKIYSDKKKAHMTGEQRKILMTTLRQCHLGLDNAAQKLTTQKEAMAKDLTTLSTNLESLADKNIDAFQKIIADILPECQKNIENINKCLDDSIKKYGEDVKKRLGQVNELLKVVPVPVPVPAPAPVPVPVPGIPSRPAPPKGSPTAPAPPKGPLPAPPAPPKGPPTAPAQPKGPPMAPVQPKGPSTAPAQPKGPPTAPVQPKGPSTAPAQPKSPATPKGVWPYSPSTPPPKSPATPKGVWPYSPPTEPPKVAPSTEECEEDIDCENLRLRGKLKLFSPSQKVVCVSKYSSGKGSPGVCVGEA